MATETGQKKKVDSGRIYRERISFLMSKEQQQVFSIYMDVTDGILLDLVADGNSWDEEELEKTDVSGNFSEGISFESFSGRKALPEMQARLLE